MTKTFYHSYFYLTRVAELVSISVTLYLYMKLPLRLFIAYFIFKHLY